MSQPEPALEGLADSEEEAAVDGLLVEAEDMDSMV
jgi:hypothetical protein